MSHSGHQIVKCGECDKVIMQCRCTDKNKPVVYKTCEDCFEKLKKIKSAHTFAVDFKLGPGMGVLHKALGSEGE